MGSPQPDWQLLQDLPRCFFLTYSYLHTLADLPSEFPFSNSRNFMGPVVISHWIQSFLLQWILPWQNGVWFSTFSRTCHSGILKGKRQSWSTISFSRLFYINGQAASICCHFPRMYYFLKTIICSVSNEGKLLHWRLWPWYYHLKVFRSNRCSRSCHYLSLQLYSSFLS